MSYAGPFPLCNSERTDYLSFIADPGKLEV